MSPSMKRFWNHVRLGLCLLLLGASLLAPAVQVSAAEPVYPGYAAPIDRQQAPESATVVVKVNANLRQGPGTTYPIVGGASAGQTLTVVGQNEAGDWYQLAGGAWIFAELVESAPNAPVASPPAAAPASGGSRGSGGAWTLVADSAADFPGGRDRNHWYYLWTEGRGNFHWRDMQQTDGAGCYRDTGGKGLEICADSITANAKGDVGLQWKASRGGTYRFEWDSASLKFYKHGEFVGILDQGTELPYAATVTDAIEWAMFFWVAADSTAFRVKVFRLDESAAPASAPAPIAPAAAPPAAALSFGSGLKMVGRDIAPGTYRSMGGDFCYWERISALYSASRSIIANGLGDGPWIVTIPATDKAFDSRRCGTWTLDLSPITKSPTEPFGEGMYFVGKDVAPGTWQSNGGGVCYWARLSGFSGQLRDIKDNDLRAGPTVVTIEPGDQGFYSRRCGTWTRLY